MILIENEISVNKTCQYINQILYKSLSRCGNCEHGKDQFQIYVLKDMQKGKDSDFEDIFQTNLQVIYGYTVENR